jgi:hypothetical protein
MEESICVDEGL